MLKKMIIVIVFCISAIMLATSCTESAGKGIYESNELFAGLESIPEASSTIITIYRGSEEIHDAYLKISIDNVISNPFIMPGQYEAWGLEWNKSLRSSGDMHREVRWYSSKTNYKWYNWQKWTSDRWKPLNYFFSIRKQLQEDDPSLTFRELQAVVWVLAGEMGIAPEFDVLSLPVNELPERLRENGIENFSREKVAGIAKTVLQQAPSASVPYEAIIAHTADDQQDFIVPGDESLNAFITTWDTRLGPNRTVTLALAGTVDATIYWGDGSFTEVNTPGPHTYDYGSDGVYTVSVAGRVTAYNSDANSLPGETQKLIMVDSWGGLGFKDLSFAFYEATNLTSVPNHSVGIENVTDMQSMFRGASKFNAPVGNWNTAAVTSFYRMFDAATNFNQPIGDWDTSTVTITARMFYETGFNQPIGNWDTSSITNMANMFLLAKDFNQSIGNWNTSNVENMKRMLDGALSFNHPIGDWNTSSVTDMSGMFNDAVRFNQDLSGWCVEKISAKPANFDSGVEEWFLGRPVWGSCMRFNLFTLINV